MFRSSTYIPTTITRLFIMTTNAKLAFGVEFELLLRPKERVIAGMEPTCSGWAAKFEQAQKAESEMAA